MAAFITRIELVSTKVGKLSEDEYTKLHQQMTSEKFVTEITSAKNVTYKLPPAEYYINGDLTGQQVYDSALKACTATKASSKTIESFRIVVTKSAGMTFSGLEEVKKFVINAGLRSTLAERFNQPNPFLSKK